LFAEGVEKRTRLLERREFPPLREARKRSKTADIRPAEVGAMRDIP